MAPQASPEGTIDAQAQGFCGAPRVRRALARSSRRGSSVLLALAAALLLYATLTAQAARAAEFPSDVGAPTLLFQRPERLVHGRGTARDRSAAVRGRRRRARARRAALLEHGHELRGGRVRAAAARRRGRRSPLDEDRRAHHRGRDPRAAAGGTDLRRGARGRAAREPRAPDERQSIHDGRRQHRAGRAHRHHDRVPADGALRRRRVQPARAADVDAALRRAGYAGGPGRAVVGRSCPKRRRRSREWRPRRAQHPAARSVRPRGARARHATRMARQPQPRGALRSPARTGVDRGARRRPRRPPPRERQSACRRRRPTCTSSIPWRRACRWTATS